MILFPSGAQVNPPPPPARGGALSPPTPEATSKSKPAVRLLGCAPGDVSITQRSGCVYDWTGLFGEATNASCLPFGLREKPPAPISIVVNFTGEPPAADTE